MGQVQVSWRGINHEMPVWHRQEGMTRRGVETRAQPVNAHSYSEMVGTFRQGTRMESNIISNRGSLHYGPSAEQLIPGQHGECLYRARYEGEPSGGVDVKEFCTANLSLLTYTYLHSSRRL